ncbi:hypothetical protein KY285_014676 [Solanum tuberosum]|nr:hypothetical protein KY284_015465 [Solanum tuberosum]KAH0718645.1 hypothetical protein KY285_014676 [Solanum tuberosum]
MEKLLLKLTGGQMNIVRASVCSLELIIVDKMLVRKSLFMMYFTTNKFELPRKQMHSKSGSPKRVLHSLEETLLRIALVHSSVPFKIVDIGRSVSVIQANLRIFPVCGFGIHLSSLYKLNASDGSFKLSGYISGVSFFLDLSNADINSRFVSKGPIHKLLNNIAMSFDSASDIEKRSRSRIYPLFLLNLNCPRSLYDLTLEPSKTSVEFKVDGDSHKWIDAGNRGKTDDEPIRKKKKSRRSHSAPPFTKARRSSLPRSEQLSSYQKLEQYGDCIILQKLSARSFHSCHPTNAIHIPQLEQLFPKFADR